MMRRALSGLVASFSFVSVLMVAVVALAVAAAPALAARGYVFVAPHRRRSRGMSKSRGFVPVGPSRFRTPPRFRRLSASSASPVSVPLSKQLADAPREVCEQHMTEGGQRDAPLSGALTASRLGKPPRPKASPVAIPATSTREIA